MKGGAVTRWLAALVVGAALLAGTFTVSAQGDTAWVGEYFDNPVLNGAPVVVRADAAINFVWGDTPAAPGLPNDRFSVRWTRAQSFAEGVYRFTARSDDGIRIYLDDRLILDSWNDRAPDPPIVLDVSISAGTHALRVEYYENTGAAVISLDYRQVSAPGGSAGSSGAVWIAQYFDNASLSGRPLLELVEQQINHDWQWASPLPGLAPADDFSVRWTGSPAFAAGTYTFFVYADDGVRMWIDDVLVIDSWTYAGVTPPRTATLTLSQGLHAMRVEYFEHLEVAAIRVEWQMVGQYWQPTAVPTPAGFWTAEYFNGTTPTGTPLFTQQIAGADLNLNWRDGSPATIIPADNFSARFTRTQYFDTGTVRFAMRVDDGFRFYVDGQLLLNEWHPASGQYHFVDYPMWAGTHTLTIEFYEGILLASLRFYWTYPQPAAVAPGTSTVRVTAYFLNVRTGPGVAYPIVGRAVRDQVFTVTGQSPYGTITWWRINFGSLQGWVSGAWVAFQGDLTQVPLVLAGG